MMIILDRPAAAPLSPVEAQRARWERLCEQLAHPDVELTAEEFIPVLSTFRALQRRGERMDRMLATLIGILERQLFGSDVDCDQDGAERVYRREARRCREVSRA